MIAPEYAICRTAIAALRRGPSNRSEMVSQLLFGELVIVREWRGRQWAQIVTEADGSECWVAQSQIQLISTAEAQAWRTQFAYVLDLFQPAFGDEGVVPLSIGARLPDFDGMRFALGSAVYTFSGQAVAPAQLPPSPELVVKLARKWINTPFLWGGRSPFGIDSPALVQLTYGLVGIKLPRTADAQLHCGRTIHFVDEMQPGDMAFFENSAGRIHHVGLVLPERQLLHVYGKTRVDTLDHFGIFCYEAGRYTHRLRILKRLLPDITAAPGSQKVKREPEGMLISLF